MYKTKSVFAKLLISAIWYAYTVWLFCNYIQELPEMFVLCQGGRIDDLNRTPGSPQTDFFLCNVQTYLHTRLLT